MVPKIDSQPTRSMAEAKYWAAPGGVRSTTRLAEASAETRTSVQSRASRPSKVANSPNVRRPVPSFAGHGVDQVAGGTADPDGPDLDQVARQGALGDLQHSAVSRSASSVCERTS